jgi:hypothetical protein
VGIKYMDLPLPRGMSSLHNRLRPISTDLWQANDLTFPLLSTTACIV